MFMWVMALCEKRGAWPTSENECTTVAHSTATQAKVGVPRDRIRHDGLASHAIGFVTTGWRPTRSDSSRRVGVPRDRIRHDGLVSHAIGFVTTGWRRRDWSPISGRRSRWVGVPRDRIVHLRSRAAHAASPPAAEQVVAHRTARHANVA